MNDTTLTLEYEGLNDEVSVYESEGGYFGLSLVADMADKEVHAVVYLTDSERKALRKALKRA